MELQESMGIRRTEWDVKTGEKIDWQLALYMEGEDWYWGRVSVVMESIQGEMWPRWTLKKGECEITDLAWVKKRTESNAPKNAILIWSPNKEDLLKRNVCYHEIPFHRYEGSLLQVIDGEVKLFTYNYTQKIDEGKVEEKDKGDLAIAGLAVNSGYKIEHEVWTNIREERKEEKKEEIKTEETLLFEMNEEEIEEEKDDEQREGVEDSGECIEF
jgi:hypothetical protein